MIEIIVNDTRHSLDNVPEDMPLLWVLRERIGLTGTKFGCGGGFCGACTVHLEGEAAVRGVTVELFGEATEVHVLTAQPVDGAHHLDERALRRSWPDARLAGACVPQKQDLTARQTKPHTGHRPQRRRAWGTRRVASSGDPRSVADVHARRK